MEDFEFSEDFCRFLQTAIPSVAAAELLLWYRGHPDSAFSCEEAVGKLGPGINVGDAARYLALFESRGLLLMEGRHYRYRPDSELAPLVDKLGQAYNQRPVTLVRVIYAFQDSNIRSFAEAFRLRK